MYGHIETQEGVPEFCVAMSCYAMPRSMASQTVDYLFHAGTVDDISK